MLWLLLFCCSLFIASCIASSFTCLFLSVNPGILVSLSLSFFIAFSCITSQLAAIIVTISYHLHTPSFYLTFFNVYVNSVMFSCFSCRWYCFCFECYFLSAIRLLHGQLSLSLSRDNLNDPILINAFYQFSITSSPGAS